MVLTFHIGFLDISLVDIIDILLVSLLLYQVYQLIEGSVAVRVFIGFLLLYFLYLIVRGLGMELLTSMLGQLMEVGVFTVIILFQQEVRKFLFLIGRTTAFNKNLFLKRLFWRKKDDKPKLDITTILEAAKFLGGSNTGALIVFSRDVGLKFYVESGDLIDAVVSKRLLMAIFHKSSPMHDGAAIIYEGKLIAARCVLPVTARQDIPPQLGLRHRAAIGMAETTDTLVLVISEENGQISIARNGNLNNNVSMQEARAAINTYLYGNSPKGA